MITVYFAKMNSELSSHELLFRAVADHSGGRSFTLSYERGKKPFFVESDAPRFSISHSKDVWICAISDREIGCDVQIQVPYPRFASVAKRYFHPVEIEEMNAASSPLSIFFDIWAKKEAVAKLTGRGLDQTLREARLADLPLFVHSITLPVDEPYSAAVASYDSFDVAEISLKKI